MLLVCFAADTLSAQVKNDHNLNESTYQRIHFGPVSHTTLDRFEIRGGKKSRARNASPCYGPVLRVIERVNHRGGRYSEGVYLISQVPIALELWTLVHHASEVLPPEYNHGSPLITR